MRSEQRAFSPSPAQWSQIAYLELGVEACWLREFGAGNAEMKHLRRGIGEGVTPSSGEGHEDDQCGLEGDGDEGTNLGSRLDLHSPLPAILIFIVFFLEPVD